MTNRLVHFGVGSFFRGHQAYYVDRFNRLVPPSDRWHYTGVNLRPESRTITQTLQQQGGRYHLKKISAYGDIEIRKIEAMDTVVDASGDVSELDSIFTDPNVKALTITVTEGGYYLTDTNDVNLKDVEIASDLTNSDAPKTVYGYLSYALKQRAASQVGAITVLTCDNLRDNGTLLENAFKQFLSAKQETELLEWVSKHVTFPCCMVDRITPVPPKGLARQLETIIDEKDECPIMGEDFEQWVIEDKFASDFPQLEKVGVTFSSQVHQYEETKIRILNGGHFLLSYVGALRNYITFDQNMEDDQLADWLKGYHQTEVIPTISHPPVDLEQYRQKIVERFSNSHIADSIERIAMDSVSKFPQFILPTVRFNLERNHMPRYAICLIAHWYCFLERFHNGKLAFNYRDPHFSKAEQWLNSCDPVTTFLSNEDVWQGLTSHFPDFTEQLKKQIETQSKEYEESGS
ncbi:putative Mannitol dehydrogenase [Vibrio nigripulchritudo SFn27]|uniref:Putative Mannitol dehydrogenase n=1 Tax=Vibrio nigripulchritudo TaxID=28173 RepID=U4KFG0_9VIBR|nr:mannitol dehydrogenase family protein [Vibrio nigripulchritudo]CCN84199.1 putative Mannitol dehydrogenase [Vibrio nigripulchritudo BLFn1]CCN87114.1 putative Mannitol dehydrogenase [Vibrio nigripulchritudo SFn27]CCN93181.1 putative Mannitol dehydrogenase [Vibrio nigripulchritudo ENn2]CCO39666.1 putative Mannitol dehydrogenase [Vibrio nigripulchritudo SFn135]CCO54371.1 putative Mannitol dehydrogenase [Vibrio nigripulchritudo Wn13]